jgi:hypothetical protein
MAWAIVASANHFFIDMLLGGLVVAISWGLARFLERRRVRKQLAEARREALAPATAEPKGHDLREPYAAAGVTASGPPVL